MYLITKRKSVVLETDNLQDLLDLKFDINILNRYIFIKPKKVNTDYARIDTVSYSFAWSEEEIIKDFANNLFIEYAKLFKYKFYKIEGL